MKYLLNNYSATDSPLYTNRALVRLICPLIIEQGLAILVGMADTVMVSSAGEAAISGVSLVDMINQLIIQIFAALATGGAVVTAQAFGSGDRQKVGSSIGQLVRLAGFVGAAVMVLCFVLRSYILKLFFGNIDSDVMEAALLYFTITLISYPFLALYNAGAAVFRSVGNSQVGMKVSVLVNVINFAGNAICIYAFKMGTAGVAVPTLVSRVAGAIVILLLAIRSKGPEHLSRSNLFARDFSMAHNILKIGIPSAFEGSLFQLGRLLVVSMIALCGTVNISANAIANNIDAIGCIIGNSMGLAMITVIGQCVGRSSEKETKYYLKKLLIWDYIMQGSVNLLIVACLHPILRLYSVSEATRSLAYILILIHCLFSLVLWPAAFVLPYGLRAANDVKFCMIVAVISMAVLRVSIGYYFCVVKNMGAIGIWISMVLDWICRTICFVSRAIRGRWMKYCPNLKP